MNKLVGDHLDRGLEEDMNKLVGDHLDRGLEEDMNKLVGDHLTATQKVLLSKYHPPWTVPQWYSTSWQ